MKKVIGILFITIINLTVLKLLIYLNELSMRLTNNLDIKILILSCLSLIMLTMIDATIICMIIDNIETEN